jgi:hypothetical protein
MIAVPSGVSIFLCTTATDMRKSFDGLTGVIRSQFSREPNDVTVHSRLILQGAIWGQVCW